MSLLLKIKNLRDKKAMNLGEMFHKQSLTGRVSIAGTILIIILGLLGVGILYFFSVQKESETQTQTAQNLKLLNSHSHPEAGEEWVVSFETRGTADLTIIPTDPDSIGDLDFVSLTCNGEKRTPQILENDKIFYPNWECLPSEALAKEGDGTGELTHLVNIARKHTLKFQFENKAAFAYNNPDSVTDSFTDESKVFATSTVVVTGGKAILATCKDNGTACSAAGECCSNYCYVDADNDRYAPSSGTATCRANSQLAGTDCYDANANAYPGSAYYSCSHRGDGYYDYNCVNGDEETGDCTYKATCTNGGSSYTCYPYSSICAGASTGYDRCDTTTGNPSCGESWSGKPYCDYATENFGYCYTVTPYCTTYVGQKYICKTGASGCCSCH